MLSIVAVVINNEEVTRRFVSSIRQYTMGKYELILVDNASHDKSAVRFFKASADQYVRFPRRVSLAAAWNKGIALAQGTYIAVMNNDVVVPPHWSRPLIGTLQNHPRAGMVTPLTFWLLKGYFQYDMLKNWNKKFVQPFKLEKFKEVIWGECCVLRKSAWRETEGYCELYKGLGSEDLEMVFQLFAHGYEVYVDPRVFVYHQGYGSQVPDIISLRLISRYQKDNWKLFKSRWPQYTQGWR
ncbi:MAG: glycosyltransferase [Patescibacteria group bacterium]